MNKLISVNLFISVYKNIAFLKKVLDSVEQQHYKNFSVTILEDGEFDEMRTFIKNTNYTFKLVHLCHKDEGFRKNKILNSELCKTLRDFVFL